MFVAKTKTLTTQLMQLICAFVFTYAKWRFSHDAAQIVLTMNQMDIHFLLWHFKNRTFRITGFEHEYCFRLVCDYFIFVCNFDFCFHEKTCFMYV